MENKDNDILRNNRDDFNSPSHIGEQQKPIMPEAPKPNFNPLPHKDTSFLILKKDHNVTGEEYNNLVKVIQQQFIWQNSILMNYANEFKCLYKSHVKTIKTLNEKEVEIQAIKKQISKIKLAGTVLLLLILLIILFMLMHYRHCVALSDNLAQINAPAIAENNAAACPAAVSVISKKADRFPRFAPVHFAWNAYAITQEHKKTMSPLVDYMIQNPDKSLVIYGNADGIGSIGNNVIIGERRLSAVKSYLAENGIDAGRIRTVNNGEDKTERTNKMPFGRYLNRRVDFEIKEYSKQESTAIRIENYFNQNKTGFHDMKANIWEDTTVYLSPISIFEKQYVIDIYVLADEIKINFFDRYDEKMSSSSEGLIDKLTQHGFAEASRGYSKTINSADFEENSDSELKTVIESLLSDLSEFGKK